MMRGKGEQPMKFPVLVESSNGAYVASLAGSESVRVSRPTREAAVIAVQSEIARRVATGELVTVDVPNTNISASFGAFADDPTLEDICDEIYRERAAEPKE